MSNKVIQTWKLYDGEILYKLWCDKCGNTFKTCGWTEGDNWLCHKCKGIEIDNLSYVEHYGYISSNPYISHLQNANSVRKLCRENLKYFKEKNDNEFYLKMRNKCIRMFGKQVEEW